MDSKQTMIINNDSETNSHKAQTNPNRKPKLTLKPT